MFTQAIVRVPGSNFADGLTSVELGVPEYELVTRQWEDYCGALLLCGLSITRLDADLAHPDSTFVEDTAVITPHGAMLTRRGTRNGGYRERPREPPKFSGIAKTEGGGRLLKRHCHKIQVCCLAANQRDQALLQDDAPSMGNRNTQDTGLLS